MVICLTLLQQHCQNFNPMPIYLLPWVMKKIINILTIDWTQFIVSLRLKYWLVYLTIMIFILLGFTPSTSHVFIYYQF